MLWTCTLSAKSYECFYILHEIFVFECTCCIDVLPGQCFCWVDRPHIQSETVLLWSTTEICEGQEKQTNIISVFILTGKNTVRLLPDTPFKFSL